MPKTTKRARKRSAGPAKPGVPAQPGASGADLERLIEHTDSSPRLTGGDVDADWERAAASGEEAVGGTVATPDQDVVDEIGRAVGVEQASTAPVTTSEEILRDRDERYWDLEWRAERHERNP